MLHYRSIRIVHFWTALFIVTPLLVFVLSQTTLFLQDAPWNREPEVERTGQTPALFFSSMIDTINNHSAADIAVWTDIESVVVTPETGTALLKLTTSQVVELDIFTGEIVRFSSDQSRVGTALPDDHSGFVKLLILRLLVIFVIAVYVFTGTYLFLCPYILALRKKKLLAEEALLME